MEESGERPPVALNSSSSSEIPEGVVLLKECTDIGVLQGAVAHLYQLLDDIDTTGDIVKSNDVAYRRNVQRIQARKHEKGVCSPDGYVLGIALPKASKQTLQASEALFGFMAWLTTRKEAVTFSEKHCAGVAADLIKEFCEVNNLVDPRDNWTEFLTRPKTKEGE